MEKLTVGQARMRLGISKNKMAKLLRDGVLPSEPHPLDARTRLIPVSAIEALEREVGKAPPGSTPSSEPEN